MAENLISHYGDFTLIDSYQSPLNGVIFHNVQSTYSTEEAVKCIYSITESIDPEVEDIVGLFKVGWASPSEAHSSIPAKMPINNERTFINTLFEVHQLPNESAELYQFCYVTKRGVVGASTPFTFESNDIVAVEDPADPGLLVFKSRVSQLKDELHRLSEEKSYYASKFEVLSENFFKLKDEFHKLDEELNFERESSNKVNDTNKSLMNQVKLLKDQLKTDNVEPKESKRDSTPEDNVSKDEKGTKAINERINSDIWKSLYEIYEVAKDINNSLKSNTDDIKLSYKALIDFIMEIFNETKLKFQMNQIGKIAEPSYCPCYYQQKSFCCPDIFNEAEFQFLMTQPLYTCFSNYTHYTKDGYANCDGSFDPESLRNYALCAVEIRNSQKNVESKDSNIESSVSASTDELHSTNNIEEKDDVEEIKLAREKIATLNSRVDVLELELVAQKSNQLSKSEKTTGNKSEYSDPSSGSLKSFDIENILESVNNEYINLKSKYDELSKKIARSDSIELKCALLEEENKKLLTYLSQASDDKNHSELPSDLKNLILEKEKAEHRLMNLQKESVGKISVNLISRENKQDYRAEDEG